jgi:hypothetical protein
VSTKIYNAFRLRSRRSMWTVTASIRVGAEKRCRAALVKLYRDIAANPKEYDYAGGPSPFAISRWVRKQYEAQAFSGLRNMWDMDVAIAVHDVGGRTLLRAFAGSSWFARSLDFLERHPDLEDYHYQNSTDRPDGITARAWSERRRTWERAMRPDGTFTHQLALEIVSPPGWHRIDPGFEMARKDAQRALAGETGRGA